MFRVFFTLPFLLSSLLALFCLACGPGADTLVISGRVELDNVHVGSRVGGRVLRVHVHESDSVTSGQVLVSIERTELEAQMAQARASAAQAKAQLDLLLAGARAEDIRDAEAVVRAREADLALRRKGFRDEEVREAAAQLASAKSTMEQARKELERFQNLLSTKSIDQNTVDRQRAAFEIARASVEFAQQQYLLRQSGSRPEEIRMSEAQLAQAAADLDKLRNGARPEEIASSRATLAGALAQVDRIASQLDEMEVRATADATVETLDLRAGDLVRAGQAVAVLNLKNKPWVRCYVSENRLGWVKPGMPVKVVVDTYPGEEFAGVVRRLASEAEFTPRNIQTVEKRSELVFEVKVDVVEKSEKLRAGMFADVRVK